MEYKMNQELITAVETIKTAILQSSNSSETTDAFGDCKITVFIDPTAVISY